MRNAGGHLPQHGELLRVPKALLQLSLAAEFIDHLVKALRQVADLIVSLLRERLGEISRRNLLRRPHHLIDRLGVFHGEKEGEADPDRENEERRNEATAVIVF